MVTVPSKAKGMKGRGLERSTTLADELGCSSKWLSFEGSVVAKKLWRQVGNPTFQLDVGLHLLWWGLKTLEAVDNSTGFTDGVRSVCPSREGYRDLHKQKGLGEAHNLRPEESKIFLTQNASDPGRFAGVRKAIFPSAEAEDIASPHRNGFPIPPVYFILFLFSVKSHYHLHLAWKHFEFARQILRALQTC